MLADVIRSCPTPTCGGKIHIIVAVGHTDGDQYYVKDPDALWHDKEFTLHRTLCTSCEAVMDVPGNLPLLISRMARDFVEDIRALRKSEDDARRN